MDLELDGHAVLVTGASSGLGLALAHRLVAEGARVALCARDADRLQRAATELTEAGGDVVALPTDVTRPADLEHAVGTAVARWGRLDGVVSNAGRAAARPLAELSDDDWQADIDLKLMAAVRLTRLALPHLRQRGGAVVTTLAVAAKAPGAASEPSSITRAAGMALTKALSKELGPDGIRVNAVLIGLLESGQWERMAAAGDRPLADLYDELAEGAGIPLGHVGPAEAYADLTAFLLSPRAAYLSGAAINLDGGLSPAV